MDAEVEVRFTIWLVLPLLVCGMKTNQSLFAQGITQKCIDQAKALPIPKCAPTSLPEGGVQLSPAETYSLATLVNIAEEANPAARTSWERAVARAASIGIERSALFPSLSFLAAVGDLRAIDPFPKPLAPRGYTVVNLPSVAPSLTLEYVVIDFGLRKARIDDARLQAMAATSDFVRQNQVVAFQVAQGFFRVQAAEELLEAAQQSLITATATQQSAEEQLRVGRATLPDLLQARAETANDEYKVQSAEGEVNLAKVALTKTVGAEPSPDILIDSTDNSPSPDEAIESSETLIERAIADRPDLKAEVERLRGSEARVREARSAYRPQVTLDATGAQTAQWPTSDYGQLGAANVSTWNVSVHVKWEIFDAGRRSSVVAQDRALARGQAASVREKKDAVREEVWTAYFNLLTAAKQQRAAQQLLEAAQSSYDASFQAFQVGVKDLIDVVTAERSLADARSTQAVARSNLLTTAAELEFSTGNILSGSVITEHSTAEDKQ